MSLKALASPGDEVSHRSRLDPGTITLIGNFDRLAGRNGGAKRRAHPIFDDLPEKS